MTVALRLTHCMFLLLLSAVRKLRPGAMSADAAGLTIILAFLWRRRRPDNDKLFRKITDIWAASNIV
jgi:hypothetical protein